MFVLEGDDEQQRPVYLTVESRAKPGSELLHEWHLEIVLKQGSSRWAGESLASIVLTKRDVAELRRFLV